MDLRDKRDLDDSINIRKVYPDIYNNRNIDFTEILLFLHKK
jgi:hypothetical protein